jgi:hypothetical protein
VRERQRKRERERFSGEKGLPAFEKNAFVRTVMEERE